MPDENSCELAHKTNANPRRELKFVPRSPLAARGHARHGSRNIAPGLAQLPQARATLRPIAQLRNFCCAQPLERNSFVINHLAKWCALRRLGEIKKLRATFQAGNPRRREKEKLHPSRVTMTL